MAIENINPYLILDGTADEAIAFYTRALDAKPAHVMRLGEVPGMDVAPENRQRIMHAELTVGAGTIMVSDAQPGKSPAAGGTAHVLLTLDDPADVDRRFDALAAGGHVDIAPHDAFWGDRFGAVTDRFGVSWMLTAARRG